MKNVLLQAAIKLNKNRKKKKWWQVAVRVMTAVVVFCTTYVLILPAITMTSKPICGLEEHVHSESCYEEQVLPAIVCGQTNVAHSHDSFCYDTQGNLICPLPQTEVHTHTDTCYSLIELVICQPDPENNPEHAHTETCYLTETVLSCQLPELAPYSHSESCVAEIPHKVLICETAEHTHEEKCYPEINKENSENTTGSILDALYLCGIGPHTHADSCHNEAGELACTIPEHVHEAACILPDLDLTADVETEAYWNEMISQLIFTGNWPEDVLTVARSQLGYTESYRNMVLENNELKGYTRYGDWYGFPYGDWCAMYVSFCLHYADVKDFPLDCNVPNWIYTLDALHLYRAPEFYTPKPGDLIFFDYEQRKEVTEAKDADHVGLVTEVVPAAGDEPAKVHVIEGNAGNAVDYRTYEMADPAIIGYGVLPVGDKIFLQYQGPDYTISVTVPPNAGIPETAILEVREILPGSEEYNLYYEQSVNALLTTGTARTEAELAVSFARFFDVSFLVDGEKVEPNAAVDVQVTYHNSITQGAGESGVAVHFADSGIEVLDAETSQATDPERNTDEAVDTFEFQQSSFSVIGTVMSTYQRALSTTATRVNPWEIDNTGATLYVLYTQIGNQYYALDGNGNAIPVTISGDTVNLGTGASDDLFWTFVEGNGAYVYNPIANLGTGRYLHPFDNGGGNASITTSNPYEAALVVTNSYFRIRGANNNYVYFPNASSNARPTTNQSSANYFYAASVGKIYNVWFDGTNGGMMSYYGADNLNQPVVHGGSGTATVTLPETWKSTPKYPYKLQGWYDINSHIYYPVNPNDDQVVTAQINGDTVFYADWVAASYNMGQDNEHVVNSLDTSDFITTYVFDYNVLFNVLSQSHTGTITSAGHTETWTIVNNGTVPYHGENTLGFAFVDYDANGDFSYANGRDNTNVNQGDAITPGILAEVYNASGGKDLLDLLFNPGTQVIGKHYVGTGNYLFQYMDSTTENYDGVHDGYYYLDARLNAASYNQSQGRFYLYDYLERTSDSAKDGGIGQYSDFLPFNSPYQFEPHMLNEYTDPILRPGYEFDAKDGANSYQNFNSPDDATTNYFFGIRTDIEFFLPNDTNTQDEYGNYGNISTRGEHMIFDFHGDDDVWVFVDGQLLLDIGGLHGVMFGQIDFSTGQITVGKDGGATETRSFSMGEGTHTMTVYYMERGSSQSNCAIYFNIAPRYDLEITKEDVYTAEMLDGAVFSIYNDEAMTSPAQLWASEEAYNADMEDGVADHATNSFTVVNGVAACWGISAGKTYYIRETTPPPGYPANDDLIRITLNNRGTATIECTTLHGSDGVPADGFAVIKQEVNDTLKIVALTVTNQKEVETTEVRVQKTWAAGSTNIPESITVYLTADGVRVGRSAVLTEANGWAYTWVGLPKYTDDASKVEVVYEVQEVLVPNYITIQGDSIKVVDHVDWVRVSQMSDANTFLLVHNGQALSYNGSFGWMNLEAAKQDSGAAAQWTVTTDHDGFHLKNGSGYTLTFNPSNRTFYGATSDAVALNQVIYYLNNRLVIHDHDVYYQFGENGTAVSSDGLAFTLYQKEVFTGLLSGITNMPVDEEAQTFVEVTKAWYDGYGMHSDDSVTISLYADGKDTGRDLVLNASNNWTGRFLDLPYFKADGTTVVQYTVVEDPVFNYEADYSDPVEIPGLPVNIWQNASSLQAGQIYSILSGSYALAMKDGDVASVPRNTEDLYQQWEAVNVYGNIQLRNLGTNTFLGIYGNDLYSANQNNAANITFNSGRLQLNNTYYLELGINHIAATTNSANATQIALSQFVETSGKPGTGFTVTNTLATYELPLTGGAGFSLFTFGGLLILMAAAYGYVIYFGRKRRKGGAKS